jgi:hypothetical protein
MTKLLDMAIEAASQLSPEEQDELARTILGIVHGSGDEVYELSEEENAAIDRGLSELEQGRYATMGDLQAVLAQYRK